ncbi:hypothetical protein H5410_041095 [Solanum commersonii]|uniref:Uncharacterized protein n=1 Tax=Solanum commersonii TaxID=4109 RepID=A0A9J5XS22_SOLCO|nr:hypothetical protein H5410_041095 [Solanum commersonii]
MDPPKIERFYSPVYRYENNGVSESLNGSKGHDLIMQKKEKKYLEFEAKHGHYLEKKNRTAEKTKKRRPEDRLMHWRIAEWP